ncbi:MAG: hypothetical protein C4330_12480 [Chitinophagaceae bacterium]
MKAFFLSCLLVVAGAAFAQEDTLAPYKRYPIVPAFQLLLSDSTTMYKKADLPKNKPTLIMLFSPECSHCKHTAEEMTRLKDSLQDIQIIMATMYPLWEMNAFAQRHGLNEWKNVVFGKDIYYILPSFYQIHNLPYMALYDKKGNLIAAEEGSLPIPKVLELFRNSK